MRDKEGKEIQREREIPSLEKLKNCLRIFFKKKADIYNETKHDLILKGGLWIISDTKEVKMRRHLWQGFLRRIYEGFEFVVSFK